MSWLIKSKEAGYFRAGANLHLLKTDTDLERLRRHPDFQKLLAEVEQDKR
jgi:hypothetical protein